ncbi:hypothetical protein ACF5W4_17170 [Bacillota bacterium Lsc_1132]
MKALKQHGMQPQLFQMIDREELVPSKTFLRQLNEVIDFSHVHDWVAPLYGDRIGGKEVD